MLIQAEKPISARMDQWTRSLSKVALQSQICVKSRAIPLSGAVLNWLYKPTAGQDMRHQKGQIDCQITMQEGHNESSLACQCRYTVLECRLIVGDVHQDHVSNDRIKGIRGRRPSREIRLHVLNPEPVALFSAESILDEGFRWLDSCHARGNLHQ